MTLQDRVEERRRAVAIARHLRESEGLSIAQIAQRLGRSEATVKGYFYDPSKSSKRRLLPIVGACTSRRTALIQVTIQHPR